MVKKKKRKGKALKFFQVLNTRVSSSFPLTLSLAWLAKRASWTKRETIWLLMQVFSGGNKHSEDLAGFQNIPFHGRAVLPLIHDARFASQRQARLAFASQRRATGVPFGVLSPLSMAGLDVLCTYNMG
jgi:hypothetical protein